MVNGGYIHEQFVKRIVSNASLYSRSPELNRGHLGSTMHENAIVQLADGTKTLVEKAYRSALGDFL